MGSKARKRRKKGSHTAAIARPTSPRSDRLAVLVVCVALSAIVSVVFGQTLNHQFVNYDDNEYVYDNPAVKNGLTPAGIVWAFTHVHSANWHPLTTISHMADCTLYGLQPWGHHLTNVLLQMAAAIFLFFALRQLTESLWASAAIAALFAAHPVHVQSVAWISERKDLLSGIFFALTLWAYAHYARADRKSRGYALANKGNPSEAISFYEAALQARPGYARAHNNFGVTLAMLGKTDAALVQFQDALRIDESDPDVHANLANLLLQLGRRDDAVSELKATLQLRPDDAEAQQQLRELGAQP